MLVNGKIWFNKANQTICTEWPSQYALANKTDLYQVLFDHINSFNKCKDDQINEWTMEYGDQGVCLLYNKQLTDYPWMNKKWLNKTCDMYCLECGEPSDAILCHQCDNT
jgi:hypothetical protein